MFLFTFPFHKKFRGQSVFSCYALNIMSLLSMAKCFLEAYSRSADRSNPRLLWKPEAQQLVQKAPVIGSCPVLGESNQQPPILQLE